MRLFPIITNVIGYYNSTLYGMTYNKLFEKMSIQLEWGSNGLVWDRPVMHISSRVDGSGYRALVKLTCNTLPWQNYWGGGQGARTRTWGTTLTLGPSKRGENHSASPYDFQHTAREQISIEVHEEFSADILLPTVQPQCFAIDAFSRKIIPPQNDYRHGSKAHYGLTKFVSHRKKTIA